MQKGIRYTYKKVTGKWNKLNLTKNPRRKMSLVKMFTILNKNI